MIMLVHLCKTIHYITVGETLEKSIFILYRVCVCVSVSVKLCGGEAERKSDKPIKCGRCQECLFQGYEESDKKQRNHSSHLFSDFFMKKSAEIRVVTGADNFPVSDTLVMVADGGFEGQRLTRLQPSTQDE